MTQQEKDVLSGIVQILENLTVKIDALESALIQRDLLMNGEQDQYEKNYRLAAAKDLDPIRRAIAYLPITR